MDRDKRTHSSHASHQGESNTETQSTGAFHPAQHAEGVLDNTTTHPPPAANDSDGATVFRIDRLAGHSRVNFDPTYTCAACKQTAPNNYALERHAAKERHKAFLCSCTVKFVRLATLNRHIADQAGPKHYCDYCDDNKGFAREDKPIDHLRSGHKFGEKAIAQFRGQKRSQSGVNGLASIAATRAGPALPVSTSTSNAAPESSAAGWQNLHMQGNSVGPSPEAFGLFHNGHADFSIFNNAGLQPFSTGGSYSVPGAPMAVAGFNDFGGGFPTYHFTDFNGSIPGPSGAGVPQVDFVDFDLDFDMSGIDNGI